MSYLKITNRRITLSESNPHLVYKEYFPRPELRYSDDQPRGDHGRWTSAGGGSGSGLTGGGDSGIIKPITIEAINECASDEVLSEECKATIYETLKSQGVLRDYDEVKIVRIPPDKDNRIEVFRTNAESSPGYPKVTLEINEAALGGMSKEAVDEMFRLDNYTAAMSLEEAIIHECGHAKILRGKTYAQYEAEDEILKGDAFTNPIKGREDKKSLKDLAGEVSEYAQKDGMECIAECHVIISRGGSIPSDVKALYDKYIS